MHNNLPSYAYFQENNEVEYFWNELEDEYYPVIYYYLIDNHLIEHINDDVETIYTMKASVLDFIDNYFV
jgi:hypothetical protein